MSKMLQKKKNNKQKRITIMMNSLKKYHKKKQKNPQKMKKRIKFIQPMNIRSINEKEQTDLILIAQFKQDTNLNIYIKKI